MLVAAACGPIVSQEATSTASSAIIDGTPEAVGVLDLVNDASTDLTVLDIDARLDKRAAVGLLHRRNGPDGIAASSDDELFTSIGEVDDVRWVGPSALGKLKAYAQNHGFVPEGKDLLGTYDGVSFSVDEALATVALANTESETALDDGLALDARAVQSILAARPIATAMQLSTLYFVGASALNKLKNGANVNAPPPSAAMFANDLRDALVNYYAIYGNDIIGSGGNDLQAAQDAVDVNAVSPIADSEDDPEGNDLSTTTVFAHPDPTFPGSDNVWFGAYDKGTGDLLNVYSFN